MALLSDEKLLPLGLGLPNVQQMTLPVLRQLEVRPVPVKLPAPLQLVRQQPSQQVTHLHERPNAVAVVCAKNEGPRIGAVLSAISRVLPVLVVDDGSSDDTAAVAKAHGATVLSLPKNVGKGQAMLAGITACGFADRVMFLDADLVGLTAEHVRTLLDALDQKPNVGMAVGLRDHKARTLPSDSPERKAYAAASRNMPLITGERVVRREVLRAVPREAWDGFGIETWLNHVCASMDYDIASVVLDGLYIVSKWEKDGPRGVVDMADMAANVVLAHERAALGQVKIAPRPASMAARGMSSEQVLDMLSQSLVRASEPYVKEHVWTTEARRDLGHAIGNKLARPVWVLGAVAVGAYVGFFAGLSVTIVGLWTLMGDKRR